MFPRQRAHDTTITHTQSNGQLRPPFPHCAHLPLPNSRTRRVPPPPPARVRLLPLFRVVRCAHTRRSRVVGSVAAAGY
jgi:hypothetical protein